VYTYDSQDEGTGEFREMAEARRSMADGFPPGEESPRSICNRCNVPSTEEKVMMCPSSVDVRQLDVMTDLTPAGAGATQIASVSLSLSLLKCLRHLLVGRC